jgi:uncharacterized protein
MQSSLIRRARQAGLAMILGGFALSAAGAAAPATKLAPLPAADVRVTEADVAESNEDIRGAFGALATMWTNDFEQMGRRFAVPRIYNYRGNVRTPCGVMMANNAAYCSAANAIFYDEIFVAGQRKLAASKLGTDGDMAGIGVIAHEMGHAAAIQLGFASRVSYNNEAVADCLAGTFVGRLQQDSSLGTLESGDVDEALEGVAAAGDPEVELTGNDRVDSRRIARQRMMAHGTSEQRVSNFKVGLDNGIRGCLPRG